MHFCALLTIRIGTLAGPIPTIHPLADFLHSPPSPPNLDSSYRLGNAGRLRVAVISSVGSASA